MEMFFKSSRANEKNGGKTSAGRIFQEEGAESAKKKRRREQERNVNLFWTIPDARKCRGKGGGTTPTPFFRKMTLLRNRFFI